MTKDTNATGGAAIKRYKIGYHTDEWGVRSSTPGGITDPSGQWVLYKDHLAALAHHGQAPAQAAPVCGSPADLPPLPDPDLRDVGTTPGGIKEFLRGYATEYAKAALAACPPADSVTAPAGAGVAHALSDGQIEAMPVWRNFVGLWPESRREIVDAVVDLLTTPPAQATDSVLEDAARRLIEICKVIGGQDDKN